MVSHSTAPPVPTAWKSSGIALQIPTAIPPLSQSLRRSPRHARCVTPKALDCCEHHSSSHPATPPGSTPTRTPSPARPTSENLLQPPPPASYNENTPRLQPSHNRPHRCPLLATIQKVGSPIREPARACRKLNGWSLHAGEGTARPQLPKPVGTGRPHPC